MFIKNLNYSLLVFSKLKISKEISKNRKRAPTQERIFCYGLEPSFKMLFPNANVFYNVIVKFMMHLNFLQLTKEITA